MKGGVEDQRRSGGGEHEKQVHEKKQNRTENLFLELKIISTFHGEISSASERHDINAKASEDKQKAPLRCSRCYPSLSRNSVRIITIPSTLPACLRYYFYILRDFFFFSSKLQFTTQGLKVISIKLQLLQVCERCIIP